MDLTRPFDDGTEHSLALPDPRIETLSEVRRDGANVQRVTFPTHSGTHVEDLQGFGELRDGDAVLLSFGWARHAGTDRYHRYPWFSTGLTEALVARDVALVAMDTLSPDQPRRLRGDGDPYPAHRRLLGAGVPVVENLADPSDLVGERVEVICLPLKLRGGDGAPARIVARRLED